MVKWQSEQELTRDMLVYDKMWPVFMGIYMWDFALTFWFDWWLLTCRTPFRWPHVPYLVARYSVIGQFVLLCTFGTNQDIGRCDIRYHLLTVVIVSGTGCASLNLAIRTVRIWNSKFPVLVIVTLLVLSQWGVLLSGAVRFFMTAFNPRQGCLVSDPHGAQIILVYATTLLVDVSVLLIGMVGLTRGGSELRIWRLGDLGRILFAQGMLYFVVTSVVNAFSVVFAALNLNTVMDIMLSVPALVVSTIASCRCVTSLFAMYIKPQDGRSDGTTAVSGGSSHGIKFSSVMDPPRSSRMEQCQAEGAASAAPHATTGHGSTLSTIPRQYRTNRSALSPIPEV